MSFIQKIRIHEIKIILCCLIIVKLQTCSSDKSNFPFKNLFFNCYFFIFSKSFSVLSECFIHDIATLLYMPLKIHRPLIACLPPSAHRLPTAHRPPAHRPPAHRPKISSPAYRPSPIARQHFIVLKGVSFCTLIFLD